MLDVERVLIDLGIEFRSAGPDNVKSFCVNPSHEETQPSMNIHRESGIIHCFGCGLSGTIFTLLAHKDIVGVDALLYLQKFPSQGHSQEELAEALEEYIHSDRVVEDTVKYGDIELPAHRTIDTNIYLEGRGITPDDIVKWNMAVVTDRKNSGWILIPIYQEGKLCNYFMRSPFGQGKLYGKYPRKHILAGLDFCTNYNEIICVSEGIFDAIAISHAGFQSVACLSNKLLPLKIKKLKKFKEIALVPDNDNMGIRLVESAGPLIHNCTVWVFPIPENKKDAGECSVFDIKKASEERVFWNEYLIQRNFA